MKFQNADAERWVNEHQNASGEASRLHKQTLRLIAAGASEDAVIDVLRPVSDAVLSVGYQFAHLAAYGYLKAYDHTLQAHMRDLDRVIAFRTADGPDKPNTFRGGTPSSVQTETILSIVNDLSYGFTAATEPEYRHRDGRKRILEAEAAANCEDALQLILPHAARVGADPQLAFSTSMAVLQSNYALVPALHKICPAAFELDYRHAQWIVMATNNARQHERELRFYDDYLFQRDHGFAGPPVTPPYMNQSLWPENSPVNNLRRDFYDALQAGNEAGVAAVFNGKVLRPSHCIEFTAAVTNAGFTGLVAPLFDATKAYDGKVLASYLLAHSLFGAFWSRDGKVNPPEADARGFATVRALQDRGGDINAQRGELLLRIAHGGRMDVASTLVTAHGADISIARTRAAHTLHTGERGENPEYPYAKANRRLAALARKLGVNGRIDTTTHFI